jgi:hypothetical protein
MNEINWDDELRLSARERGHTYGEGDVIRGVFEDDEVRVALIVSVERHHGSLGYYTADGMPVRGTIIAWEYVNPEELEALKESEES